MDIAESMTDFKVPLTICSDSPLKLLKHFTEQTRGAVLGKARCVPERGSGPEAAVGDERERSQELERID